MFDPGSRYEGVEQGELELPDGRIVRFRRRRFLPRAVELQLLTAMELGEGDRLDLLANRAYNNPEAWWRICDANEAMNPREIEIAPGSRLVVPIPKAGG